jgi:L-ascorbate oxidase
MADENGGLDPSSQTYPVKLGEVLDIVIQMKSSQLTKLVEAHPWHSHGKKVSRW